MPHLQFGYEEIHIRIWVQRNSNHFSKSVISTFISDLGYPRDKIWKSGHFQIQNTKIHCYFVTRFLEHAVYSYTGEKSSWWQLHAILASK